MSTHTARVIASVGCLMRMSIDELIMIKRNKPGELGCITTWLLTHGPLLRS